MSTGIDSRAGLPPIPPPTTVPEPPSGKGEGSPLPSDGEPLHSPAAAAIAEPPVAASPGVGPPPWFRLVVWDSLLGACCQLLPLPIVDDMALSRVRRRVVTRLLERWRAPLAPHQVALLAGGGRRWTVSRMAGKAFVYPVKRLFRKLLYFLAIKEAVDTFSVLFHQGFLLHAALIRGALAGPPGEAPDDARVRGVAAAVHETLGAADTGPLRQLVYGVFRNSRRLTLATLRWLAGRLAGRADITEVEVTGASAARLDAGSPEAEQLLETLLLVLWGEVGYRQRLERELERRLAAPATPPPGG
jgi:hypothetical protein